MGSGKSTVGPRLAERLGWSFTDLDDHIEAQAGRSITTIFSEEGETAFRALEAEALQQATEWKHSVVALGGGALADASNLHRAKASGFVVYLHASAEELARRLQDQAAHRPLLQDTDGRPLADEALSAKIKRMLSERASFYEQAHATIRTGAHSPGATVDAVEAALQE